jgi:DNA-binding CsgD family transcriptional regulator
MGIGIWRLGDSRRATALEKESLRFNDALDDALGVAIGLETLAWIAAGEGRFERAARLLGALKGAWGVLGAPLSGFGHLACYHDECEARTLRALGEQDFRAAVRDGAALPYEEAIAYALQEEAIGAKPMEPAARLAPLTRRETEIAELVSQGLSNKEIAAALVISQRTAEGHIEHILNKLGFNSRAQVAAWLSERRGYARAVRTT